jgi:hypothetical protein
MHNFGWKNTACVKYIQQHNASKMWIENGFIANILLLHLGEVVHNDV